MEYTRLASLLAWCYDLGRHVMEWHLHLCRGKKRWIAIVPSKGQLWLDEGASTAVRQQGKSLFAAGVTRVVGAFNPQDAVQLCDVGGEPFAQGLCNYSSQDVMQIQVSPIM